MRIEQFNVLPECSQYPYTWRIQLYRATPERMEEIKNWALRVQLPCWIGIDVVYVNDQKAAEFFALRWS